MLITVQSHSVLFQTGGEYLDEEQSHLGVPPLYIEQSEYAQHCYDATWTLAYALDQTINGTLCVWCVCVCACVRACMRVCACETSSNFYVGMHTSVTLV